MKLLIALMLITAIGISYTNSIQSTSLNSFASRKTIDTVMQQTGIVKQIGEGNSTYFIIRYDAGFLNIYPLNLPKSYRINNTTITFSGAMKYMHPNEDEFGQYFVLSAIEKK